MSSARQVAAAGIKHVAGDVLVDDGLFDSAQGTGSGPGRLTPIMINDNCVDVRITPTNPGEPAQSEWRPKTAAVRVDVQVETITKGSKTQVDIGSAGENSIVVRGQIAAGDKPIVRIHEVDDAASFGRTLLIEALRRAGVRVDGSPLESNDDDELPDEDEYVQFQRVAVLLAPVCRGGQADPEGQSQLARQYAAAAGGGAAWPAHACAGLHLQHEFLKRAGVDVDSISFGGGAGGDRADYTSPRATVQLLRYMATRGDFDVYRQALPILGVDGTLATAVGPGSPARGKVQAKTGTLVWSNLMNGTALLNSKALAGYATTAGGKQRVFAMFVNQVQMPTSDDREHIGQVLGRVCEEIVKDE